MAVSRVNKDLLKITSNAEAIVWMQKYKLLRTFNCPKCHQPTVARSRKILKKDPKTGLLVDDRRYLFICSRHSFSKGLYVGSFFKRPNLQPYQMVHLLYYWAIERMPSGSTRRMAISGWTADDWYYAMQQTIFNHLVRHLDSWSQLLGGPGRVVEVAKCFMDEHGNKKLLVGYERDSQPAKFFIRELSTTDDTPPLLQAIRDLIRPGTTIITTDFVNNKHQMTQRQKRYSAAMRVEREHLYDESTFWRDMYLPADYRKTSLRQSYYIMEHIFRTRWGSEVADRMLELLQFESSPAIH